MRHVHAVAITAAMLALAGCSSEEHRQEVAGRSVKASLQAAGLSKVNFKSISGDGVDRIVLNGVSAEAAGGMTVAIKSLTIEEPDLGPMLVRWHDFGPITVKDWVLYGGYDPKPTGFKARAMKASDVTLAMEGQIFKAVAGSFELKGYDSTRKGFLRYSGYAVQDMAFTMDEREVARISSAKVEASKWANGLSSPLSTKSMIEGSLALAAAGPLPFLPEALRPTVDFSLAGESNLDLDEGTFLLDGKLVTKDFGNVAMSMSVAGIDRKLVDLLEEVSKKKDEAKPSKPAAKDQKPGKGKKAGNSAPVAPSEPVKSDGQKVMEAAASVSLTGLKVEGSGLEWLGPIMDGAFGSREIFANLAIPFVDRGFAGPEKSEAANASLAGIYLFIKDPGSFTLSLEPEEPFVFGEKGMRYYLNPNSGPLDALGFNFKNGNGDE